MTLTEKELLSRFLDQLASAQAGQKDAEADTMIRQAVAKQPDSAYLLTQRTIQLEQLLAASQAEVQKLKEQASPAAQGGGGFLSGAWGRSSGTQSTQAQQRPAGAPTPAMAANAGRGGWGSGLFGNIAATAAGVVAGSFLFQGIQGMMNRDDASQAASSSSDFGPSSHEPSPDQLGAQESYDTAADGGGDVFADSGDFGGDFGGDIG